MSNLIEVKREAPGDSIAVMSYNILVGGNHGRMAAIEAVLRDQRPDIVGVQEANDPDALDALADRLGMRCVVGYVASGFHVALLSRFPLRAWAVHGHPLFQKALIEAVVDIPGEPEPWHVFNCHLTADFVLPFQSERRRAGEARACVESMGLARRLGRRHVLLGDFNAISPGEGIAAVELLRRVIELDDQRARTQDDLHGHPHLRYIIPRPLHPLLPLIRRVPATPALAGSLTALANVAWPRLAVPALLAAGYVDCLRLAAGDARVPPTCPLPRPAGRIDYIWADPATARRLQSCEVVLGGDSCPVDAASDHRPVLARFKVGVASIR